MSAQGVTVAGVGELAGVTSVVRSLGHTTTGPQDAAALLLALAGDGTGGTSLLAEVAAAVARITGHAAEQLPADAARHVIEAARMVEMTLTQVVGDYLAGALDLLEQPGRLPVVEFTARHGLVVEGDDTVVPCPAVTTPTPAAAPALVPASADVSASVLAGAAR
ncbi:hypothetical protein KCMC57_65140 (plasmid) [Kitasatospora sp. CMC57]|uniref:Uncharacterized protein n=1 Tax=Kitasatospora sp. CMC57 TaxID=3231513 RepID=A0AB33K5T8_9ACTN